MALAIALVVALATWVMPVHAWGAVPADAPYAKLVRGVGRALSVSPVLIQAVISAESSGNANARSPAGALGLMQLMPESGALEAYRYLYGRDGIPTDASLLRPEVSVWLGAAYLKLLGTRYMGWIDDAGTRLLAVIAAYNWGPTRVLSRLLPDREQISTDEFVARAWARAPTETQMYLRRVVSALQENAEAKVATR